MERRLWFLGLVVVAILGACDPPERGVRVAGTTRASLAVGARYRFAVIDACEYAGPGFVLLGDGLPLIIPTPPTCLATTVYRIQSITFTNNTVVRVTQQAIDHGGALFEVEAIGAGTTRFTVTIMTTDQLSYTASGEFTAEAVTQVALDGVCEVDAPEATDELVPAGRGARYRPALLGASGTPLAGFGYLPILVDGAPLALDDTGAWLLLSTQPTQVVVTTPIDPGYRKVIEVFAPSAATEVRLATALPALEVADRDAQLESVVMVGARHACVRGVARHVVAETPAACGLYGTFQTPPPTTVAAELDTDTGWPVYVRGLQRGATCRVRMDVVGGTAAGVIELPVREGWTLMTPPSGIVFVDGVSLGAERTVLVGYQATGPGTMPQYAAALAEWNGATWTAAFPSIPANATGAGQLRGVAERGGTQFAVGTGGAILTRTGAGAWSLMTSGTTADLEAVLALSPTDVIAVGAAGTVVRLVGGAWQPVAIGAPPTATLRAVWGTGPADLYVGGDDVLRRFDGNAWSAVDVSALVPPGLFSWRAIWGSGPDDVYAGGAVSVGGALLHWDGQAWRRVLDERVTRVWGTGPDDVYAAGKVGFGEVLRWDGRAWTARNVAESATTAIWGWGTQELYALDLVNKVHRYR